MMMQDIKGIVEPQTSTKHVYKSYAVTSDLDVASEVGKKIIQRGGNAVDAAIGTALAVGAINAFASGIGGGGFMLVQEKNGGIYGYNFREKAPENAAMKHYTMPSDTMHGSASIGIPGEISGMYLAHSKHGKLPWSELFTETIEILENGYEVPHVLGIKIDEWKETIMKDKGLRETYTVNGKLVKKGDKITRKNLAMTMKILAKDPHSMYTGEIAESLIAFINREKHGVHNSAKNNHKKIKIIEESKRVYVTDNDFANYTAEEMVPIIYKTEGDMKVSTLPLPTCGYMIISSLITIDKLVKLDNYGVKDSNKQARILLKIYEHLFRIRSKLEDMQNEKKNKEVLEKKTLNEEVLRKQVEEIIAISYADNKQAKQCSAVNPMEDSGTTHINVVDKDMMMVAMTSTINNYWGSGMMDPNTGIILNNQLDDFVFHYMNQNNLQIMESPTKNISNNMKNSHKSMNIIHNKPEMLFNTISAYKRPLSSAIPVIIKHNNTYYITGGSGGIRIPTTIISVMCNVLFRDIDIDTAIKEPRMHMQDAKKVHVERGYDIKSIPSNYEIEHDVIEKIYSCMHMIKVDKKTKKITAAADGRKHGGVAGE